jgi:hypothetical protein
MTPYTVFNCSAPSIGANKEAVKRAALAYDIGLDGIRARLCAEGKVDHE